MRSSRNCLPNNKIERCVSGSKNTTIKNRERSKEEMWMTERAYMRNRSCELTLDGRQDDVALTDFLMLCKNSVNRL